MSQERIRRAGRPLHRALALPSLIASLTLVAVLLLPAESSAATCTPKKTETADFNADCNSDIVWRNSTTGLVYIWFMNGTTIASSASPGSASSDWVIQGVGDFDGDGNSDILWRNSTTGQVYLWLMNTTGTAPKSSASPATPTSDWTIRGIGDFDGDGKADIVWQNSTTGQVFIWFMNGTAIDHSASPGSVPSSDWSIQGVGDFDGDGHADIVWQNGATGEVYVWLMNATGTAPKGSGSLGSVASDWSIQGVGDFDGDGKADILWRNSSKNPIDGLVYIWFMNGTAIDHSASPGSTTSDSHTTCCVGVGDGWTIQAVGDFNGDGHSDILWHNANGQAYIWLMNATGTAVASSGSPGSPTLDWQIASLAPYNCSTAALCNILSATNNVRANGSSGAPPWGPGNAAPSPALFALTWDVGAARVAAGWAAQCIWPHNPNTPYGENVFAVGTPANGTNQVIGWAAEAANYTLSNNSCAPGQLCGHWTQLVWRSTSAVGCAIHTCATWTGNDPNNPPPTSPADFVVCDYSPPGNWGVAPY